jgi:small GTP-binding protein
MESEEAELLELLETQSASISQSLKPGGRPLSILVTGGSASGKSTLIKAIFGEKIASVVDGQKLATGADSDGKPVTQCVTAYRQTDPSLELIDTPGLEKNVNANRVEQIKREMKQKDLKPSIIWIVLNYSSSMEDVELDLIELAPDVPTIVIINKIDLLQKRKKEINETPECVERFDQLALSELPGWMQKAEGLMSRRKRLLKWKESHPRVRRVLIMSLGDPDMSDSTQYADFHEPIGLDVVLGATWGCLDDVGRVQLAELQNNSKLGKTKASGAIVLTAMVSSGGK